MAFRFLHYEHRRQPLISRARFMARLMWHAELALAMMAVSLLIGMCGYHWLADRSWIDSFLNAAMLLGGMGPVGDLTTTSGKLFAGLFALYAGIVFLIATAIILTPVFHRVLHRFHWEADSDAK